MTRKVLESVQRRMPDCPAVGSTVHIVQPGRRVRRARVAVVALTLALLGTALVAPSPSEAASSSTSAWFKPGNVFTWQFPDPSVYEVGPFTWAASTGQGGAHLPLMWSTESATWIARTDYTPNPYNADPYLNDALVAFGAGWPRTIFNHSWMKYELWAPSIARFGNTYVAYFAVRQTTSAFRFCIYTATASKPAGPFAAQSTPLVCRGINEPSGQNATTNPNGYIDPDVFVDANGAAYLIFKSEGGDNANYPKLWSRRLTSNGLAFTASPAAMLLTRNTNPPGGTGNWEGNIIENPSMVRHSGKYFLFYSGNLWRTSSYATGYAVCSGPQGPCSRPVSTPLLQTGGANGYGPGAADGHVDARGRLKVAYHGWRCAGGNTATCGDGQANRRTFRQAWLAWDGAKLVVKKAGNSWGSGTDYIWTYDSTGDADAWSANSGGTYTPVAGDFTGDGADEIYWYGTETTVDYLATFSPTTLAMSLSGVNQSGAFLPVAGDFNGDGNDDVYWYAPGNQALVGRSDVRPEDVFWLSDGASMHAQLVTRAQDGFGYPVAGDFTGDGTDDLWWTAPGAGPEALWDFDADGAGVTVNVIGKGNVVVRDSTPLVGDFDGDGIDDIFYYGRGTLPDQLWTFNSSGNASAVAKTVNGDYRPFTGDFDGNGVTDIFWYGPGPGTDYLWFYETGGTFTATKPTNGGYYTPVVGDLNDDGVDDVYWYN
ncbi:MAG TPA: family 43 glycosylhydrolase [Acidimicrobiia bacterium]|nr:family 43 glycosylhydrolase [Acidimicrobiia bacterium]